jgi:hypothetical protein
MTGCRLTSARSSRGNERGGPQMLGLAYATIQVLGLLAAGKAVMEARTAQGATAWALALVAFPLLALPLFLVFGQSRFRDYVTARRAYLAVSRPAQQRAQAALRRHDLLTGTPYTQDVPFERLAKLPFTDGNDATLLIDGAATFASIFAGIAAAREYVLVQFYILRDDGVGRELRERLLERTAAGVRVHLLYDEVGSYRLPRAYLDGLRRAGVAVQAFHAVGRGASRLHLNFRNHRKVVVVDGRAPGHRAAAGRGGDVSLPGRLHAPKGHADRRRLVHRRNRQFRQPLVSPQLRDHDGGAGPGLGGRCAQDARRRLRAVATGLRSRSPSAVAGVSLCGAAGSAVGACPVTPGESGPRAQLPSSTRCTKATAIAPSPTAEAKRRTALWRTSPAANTPGILVSR